MLDQIIPTPLNNEFIPYYYQIANILENKFEHGEFPPGSKLPGELKLAKMFGVSRISIRQALSLLAEKGLVNRQKARGTFVSEDIKISRSIRLTGLIANHRIWGSQGELHLLSTDTIRSNRKSSDFFGIQLGDSLVRVRRLRMVGRIPYCHITHFLTEKTANKISDENFQKIPIILIFQNQLRNPVHYIHQTIEASLVSKDAASHLKVKAKSPVIYVETFMFDEKSNPLGFSQRQFRADRFRYTMDLKRSKGSGQMDWFDTSVHIP